jgi:hypothetical protein
MSTAIETLASEHDPPVPKRLTVGADARYARPMGYWADADGVRLQFELGREAGAHPRCGRPARGRRRLPETIDTTIVVGTALGEIRWAFVSP